MGRRLASAKQVPASVMKMSLQMTERRLASAKQVPASVMKISLQMTERRLASAKIGFFRCKTARLVSFFMVILCAMSFFRLSVSSRSRV